MSTGKKFFIAGCFILLAVVSLFLFRNAILDYVINRVTDRIQEKTGLVLHIDDAGFEGIRNVYVKNVSMVQPGMDTLITVARSDVKISFSQLFRLRIAFDEIFADSIRLNLVRYSDSTSNYDALFRNKKDTVSEKKTATGYNEIASAVLSRVNDLFNENIILQSLQVNYTANNLTEQLRIPELLYDHKDLKASIITASGDGVAAYVLRGTADAGNTSYNFQLIRTSDDKSSLPFIYRFDNFKVTFDTLDVKLDADPDASPVPLNVSLRFKNLIVNQWRISPVDVLFADLGVEIKLLADENRISSEKGSLIRLLDLPVNINGYYERQPEKHLAFNIYFDSKAENFFSSLPPGMFNTLKGFEATGQMHFKLETDLLLNKPEDVKFDASLKKENFKITRFGEEYFPLINNEFQFTAMDGDRAVRSILVGPENPMFTSYADISPYLKMSVLTSEDPSFLTHNGFVEEAFRESVAKNIAEHRFARGGSTISMQLVKNLFLSRNKTISRKLEEALVVWIIEQNRLVSKERMFEIYLNIIEWGPDVYGVGEASRFYFSKLPRELNLSESIYLASIIPHPKYFKYMFDSTGTLKEQQKGFYTLVGNRLLTRNLITQPELEQVTTTAVKLNGMALNLISPMDAMPVDSL
ncbi:MAG: transglycosylase domain-containing protein, partial [Bacteroidota bacterium]